MGFLSKLFGKAANPAEAGEHAVLLHGFGLDGEVQEMHDLQDELERAIKRAKAGMLDGDEFGGGECVVFLYGPDADALWEAVAPVLEKRPFRKGSYAVRRYGSAEDAREERVDMYWPG